MSYPFFPPEKGVEYVFEGDQICTNGAVRKKMSGSRLAGILGISPFSSPFQVACDLLGLGRRDLGTSPSARAGTELEPIITAYAGERWPQFGQVLHASAIFGEHEGDHDTWRSDFLDEYFEGRLDGAVSLDGEDYVFECKTTSHIEDWVDGVPEYYYWQVALYNQFMFRQPRAYVVMGFLSEAALKDPSVWVPCERNTNLFVIDFDLDAVEEKLDHFREWYDTYISEGLTPPYDPENKGDVELFHHLTLLASDETEIQAKVDRYVQLNEAIDSYDAKIQDLRAEAETLKDDIKKYMITHKLSLLETTNGEYYGSLYDTTRNTWNEAQMRKDGIQIDKYKTKTISKAFTIKSTRK